MTKKTRSRLEVHNISRIYRQASPLEGLTVFSNVSFKINPGEKVALFGPSGVGKSSLLHICGLLEKPTHGSVSIDGAACSGLSDRQMSDLRLKKIGFIYQRHHLFHDLSVVENVMVPQLIAGISFAKAREKAKNLLEQMDLLEKAEVKPSRLSGGQRQRVSIARALINEPVLILADEPTGSLDQETAGGVMRSLLAACAYQQTAVLMATHNELLAHNMDRVFRLSSHTLIEEMPPMGA